MKIEQILLSAVRGGASDIILKVGLLPHFRFNGRLIPLTGGDTITQPTMVGWLQQLYPNPVDLPKLQDLDFAFQSQAGHRFRVNVFKQRGELGMVVRVILGHIRTLEELQLPSVVRTICQEKRGLVLVTGATGSGKSTTLAAMIEKINHATSSHIITIEDPIEYIFRDHGSIIEQREVGLDTPSFAKAIRAAMRQNPDIIMVGELRDRASVKAALQAAETGHFVLSTLHTADAVDSLQRLLSYFPASGQPYVRRGLSLALKAVISQRLVTKADGVGMVPAVEVLVMNPSAKEAVLNGNTGAMRDIIREGHGAWGMQSFDQSLVALFTDRLISQDEALRHATSRGDMELALNGVS